MSKEMLELAAVIDQAWSDLVEKDDRTSPEDYPDMALITADELREFMERVATLRASAVVEPEPHDPSQYCRLDACKREGCTRLAHMCLSRQPHPAPAAPVPASVREALALELASYDSIISAAKSDEALSDTGRQRIIECATDAKGAVKQFARHLASIPAPAAAPTREEIIEQCAVILDSAAQDWNRIRDPGMANNAKSYAKKIRALKAAPHQRQGE